MNLNIEKDKWMDFFKEFNKKNLSRPSRLEKCDEMGVQTEVKILPFIGIDLEMKGKRAPKINVVLGDGTKEGRHFSHDVDDVNQVLLKVGDDGQDEVLEIESGKLVKTLLSFETLPEISR